MPFLIPAPQSAAAFVPYTKKRKEWIIATVVQHVPDTREYVYRLFLYATDEPHRYIVKDQFPDSRKKSNTYKVGENCVVAYPAGPEEVFSPSDDVLSLWLGDDSEWSSVFYRATVVAATDKVCLPFEQPKKPRTSYNSNFHRIQRLSLCHGVK